MIKKLITKLGLLDTYINYKQGLMIKEHNLIANLWREKIDAFNKGNITPPNLTAKHPELVGKKLYGNTGDKALKTIMNYLNSFLHALSL